MKTLLISALLFWAVIAVAHAECTYEGSEYPTGTVIGPLVCTADGTWQQR